MLEEERKEEEEEERKEEGEGIHLLWSIGIGKLDIFKLHSSFNLIGWNSGPAPQWDGGVQGHVLKYSCSSGRTSHHLTKQDGESPHGPEGGRGEGRGEGRRGKRGEREEGREERREGRGKRRGKRGGKKRGKEWIEGREGRGERGKRGEREEGRKFCSTCVPLNGLSGYQE